MDAQQLGMVLKAFARAQTLAGDVGLLRALCRAVVARPVVMLVCVQPLGLVACVRSAFGLSRLCAFSLWA